MSFIILRVSCLKYMRTSSATWSFLLLAVCSFNATFPTFCTRAVSICIWISSILSSNLNFPFSISSFMASSPLINADASSFVMIDFSASILQWAILPSISQEYSRLSISIEDVNTSTLGSVLSENLPSQVLSDIHNLYLLAGKLWGLDIKKRITSFSNFPAS